MVVKNKQFQSSLLTPKTPPDGSSLQEILDVFLATLLPKDVLDVISTPFSGGKYGLTTTYVATVIYQG